MRAPSQVKESEASKPSKHRKPTPPSPPPPRPRNLLPDEAELLMRAVGGAWCPPDEDSEALEAEAPEPAYPVGQYQRRPDKLQLMYTPRVRLVF